MSNTKKKASKTPPALDKFLKEKKEAFKKADIKKILIMNIPYIITGYLFDKMSWLYRQADADLVAYKISHVAMNFTDAFTNPLPSIHPIDLFIGAVAGLILKGVIVYKRRNAKKFRYGTEFGSARWGNAKDIEPFVDENEDNNIILTATERLTMNNRPKDPKTARNKNVVTVGGSGSGKTRFFVKPQLMQLHSSYCVTDPKGQVLVECGRMLQRHGYVIKVLNTINFKKSQHYNPFMYIRSEKDILKLVNTLVANTKGEGDKAGEDFWVKSEKLLYQAYIGYIWYEAPEDEQNFTMLLDMINASEVREEDETFKNAVDLLFEDLEAEKPDHFAVRQYKKYKLSAGKTAKSILISCGARLAPFDIKELRDLTEYDELELDTLGDKKTALFIIISGLFTHSSSVKKTWKGVMSFVEVIAVCTIYVYLIWGNAYYIFTAFQSPLR